MKNLLDDDSSEDPSYTMTILSYNTYGVDLSIFSSCRSFDENEDDEDSPNVFEFFSSSFSS